jgi:hypothetical protein
MRHEVISRATDAVYEFVTNSGDLNLRSPAMSIAAIFDKFHLDIEIDYDGPPMELTNRVPKLEELANGMGPYSLIKSFASRPTKCE